MKIVAYKVLTRTHEGKLLSFFTEKYTTTEYQEEEDKVTRPKEGFGPLATFTSLIRARAFLQKHSHNPTFHEIWEVLIEPSQEFKLWMISRFSKSLVSASIEHLPPGTILADSVELIRKVE